MNKIPNWSRDVFCFNLVVNQKFALMKLREQLLFYLKSLHCPGPLLATPVRRQKISKTKREQKTRAKTYQIRHCYSYTVEKEWLK